jgi:hypothetical protein
MAVLKCDCGSDDLHPTNTGEEVIITCKKCGKEVKIWPSHAFEKKTDHGPITAQENY